MRGVAAAANSICDCCIQAELHALDDVQQQQQKQQQRQKASTPCCWPEVILQQQLMNSLAAKPRLG
jgi:hypothetical protein